MEMDALKMKVKELVVNQDHMLNAIKFLSEKLEEVTEKVNNDKSDVRELLESQAMIDALVVKTSDDILSIKKAKEENLAAIKKLDTKIDQMKKEIETVVKNKNERDITRDRSRKPPSSTLNCNLCERTFQKNCDLETHIKDNHEKYDEFSCDQCDKIFVTEWRLQKHTKIHSDKKQRNCHYFNNGKHCPFEMLGCKFLHILSDNCKLGQSCSLKLCSYQHSRVVPKKVHFKDIEEEVEVEDSHMDSISGHSVDDIENSGSSAFQTSTPIKHIRHCDECVDKSECTDCFVQHMVGNMDISSCF